MAKKAKYNTTGGAGYIPPSYGQGVIDYIRRKLYDNIIPFGYNNPTERVVNAVIKNMKEEYDPAYRVSDDTQQTLDDIWGTYLQIPLNLRHTIHNSNGIIRSAGPDNKEYYLLKNLDPIIDEIVDRGLGHEERYKKHPKGDWNYLYYPPILIGEVVPSNTQNQILGEYQIGRGIDDRGEYLSYQDTWDINPFLKTTNQYGADKPEEESFIQSAIRRLTPSQGDASFGIGKPVNIYGKVYLDDIYGVQEPTHATYLPEVTVWGNKKDKGGSLKTPLDWNELSMKERAAYIRMGVANGYKDIDSIKGVYNQFKKGGPTRKQIFLNTLEKSLANNSRYNTPGWKKYLTDLANMESGYQAGITNSIGAKGYFQLMPDNRAASWSTPTQLFDEMYRMTDANMDYLRRNMTTADLKKADELGIDIYGLMAGAHLGGAKNALKAIRGTKNAKDMNGTSVMSYMTRFSQTTPRVTGIEGGMIPIIDNTYLASPEDEAISNTVVVDPNAVLEDIKGNIPQAITIDDEEPIAMTRDIPEVTVIGHQKPNLVAMQDFIDTVSNSTTPMQPIYQLQEPVAMKDVMQQVNNDRVTFLQKDLEDRLLADERRRRLGYDYRDNVAKDIDDLRFLRNMSAEGGYLFPTGGPLITVNPGDRVFTDECALWSNSTLRDNGYLINGNAWNLGNVDMLYNGFDGLTRPETYDSLAVMDYNHQATLNVFKNFDSKTLDTKKPYVVNMFYNNSPSLETAYNEGDEVTGTHTGLLTFDPDTKKWWVTHNIHGNIHQEPFIDLQKNTGKYGVTAIYAPRPKTVWNRVKGFFGFEDGGLLYNQS